MQAVVRVSLPYLAGERQFSPSVEAGEESSSSSSVDAATSAGETPGGGEGNVGDLTMMEMAIDAIDGGETPTELALRKIEAVAKPLGLAVRESQDAAGEAQVAKDGTMLFELSPLDTGLGVSEAHIIARLYAGLKGLMVAEKSAAGQEVTPGAVSAPEAEGAEIGTESAARIIEQA